MNNLVILSGFISNELELKEKNGTQWLSFGIAVHEKEGATFFDCIAFNANAKFIKEYFEKGSPISVQGKLKKSKWKNGKGEERETFNIDIEKVNFVPTRKK